jgi:hypothetical protein
MIGSSEPARHRRWLVLGVLGLARTTVAFQFQARCDSINACSLGVNPSSESTFFARANNGGEMAGDSASMPMVDQGGRLGRVARLRIGAAHAEGASRGWR